MSLNPNIKAPVAINPDAAPHNVSIRLPDDCKNKRHNMDLLTCAAGTQSDVKSAQETKTSASANASRTDDKQQSVKAEKHNLKSEKHCEGRSKEKYLLRSEDQGHAKVDKNAVKSEEQASRKEDLMSSDKYLLGIEDHGVIKSEKNAFSSKSDEQDNKYLVRKEEQGVKTEKHGLRGDEQGAKNASSEKYLLVKDHQGSKNKEHCVKSEDQSLLEVAEHRNETIYPDEDVRVPKTELIVPKVEARRVVKDEFGGDDDLLQVDDGNVGQASQMMVKEDNSVMFKDGIFMPQNMSIKEASPGCQQRMSTPPVTFGMGLHLSGATASSMTSKESQMSAGGVGILGPGGREQGDKLMQMQQGASQAPPPPPPLMKDFYGGVGVKEQQPFAG